MSFRVQNLAWAAVGIFAVGAVTGWAAPTLFESGRAAAHPVSATPAPTGAATPGLIAAGSAPNYRAIVAQNQAAVVGITTTEQMNVSSSPPDIEVPFGEYPFNNDDNEHNPFYFFRHRPNPRAMPMHAQGSGFIVSPDGLVLSNAHVVDGAKQVTVRLSDHREFKAKVLGADKSSDIAVLKIDAHGLPTLRLGDSDKLAVGDYVLAIGAPFGLEETATAGIVSATGRSLPGDSSVPFIQTDAAVNPGNSGGPLFDSAGEVVGITSQIFSSSGGYQGVAFAIPINLAEQIKAQIVATGKVQHGRLGIEVQDLNQSLADSFKLKEPMGALVSSVLPDSAAEHAGLKAGDVVIGYNGAPVVDSGQLAARISTSAPGSKATLKVWRQGEPMTMTARIGSASDVVASNASSDTKSSPAAASLGLTVRPLTPDERDQDKVGGGLVVQDAQGPAAEAGIQQGDLVLSVNGSPVHSVSQLRDLVHEHDKQIALLIQRGDARIFVPIQMG
jgi:serine protease Do